MGKIAVTALQIQISKIEAMCQCIGKLMAKSVTFSSK